MLWKLSTTDWMLLILIFGCISYICGWIGDLLLQRVGFGPLLNAVIILLGAFGGMFFYNKNGHYLFRDPTETYIVIGISAFSAIIILASMKRLLIR